jgi:hypothetical protein
MRRPIAARVVNVGLILVSAIPLLIVVNLAYQQYVHRGRAPRVPSATTLSPACILRLPSSRPGGDMLISRRPPSRVFDAHCG